MRAPERSKIFMQQIAKRSKKMKPSDQQLKVEVVRGKLVISIGIDTLAFAFTESTLAKPWNDSDGDYRAVYTIEDELVFAKEVATALKEEAEDGTTPVTVLLDAAMDRALDNGAEGVCDLREGD